MNFWFQFYISIFVLSMLQLPSSSSFPSFSIKELSELEKASGTRRNALLTCFFFNAKQSKTGEENWALIRVTGSIAFFLERLCCSQFWQCFPVPLVTLCIYECRHLSHSLRLSQWCNSCSQAWAISWLKQTLSSFVSLGQHKIGIFLLRLVR